eukprot:1160393-Pelagomonas_calceolata.AAC.14
MGGLRLTPCAPTNGKEEERLALLLSTVCMAHKMCAASRTDNQPAQGNEPLPTSVQEQAPLNWQRTQRPSQK